MIATLADLLRSTWDSLLGRVLLCGVCFGWVPFYLLGRVMASLADGATPAP